MKQIKGLVSVNKYASGRSCTNKFCEKDYRFIPPLPFTASEIDMYARARDMSPIQVNGPQFNQQIQGQQLNHFCGYSNSYDNYSRFAASSVRIQTRIIPYYSDKKNQENMTAQGKVALLDMTCGHVYSSQLHHANGIIIGDDKNFDAKMLVATAYRNVANCIDHNLDPICEQTSDIKDKCFKMNELQVIHPYMPQEIVPATLIDYDIEQDIAILLLEREIKCSQYMNVTKDDVFIDMIEQDNIENIVSCAVNNQLQVDGSFQKHKFLNHWNVWQDNSTHMDESILDVLYGYFDCHCFIGLNRDLMPDVYPMLTCFSQTHGTNEFTEGNCSLLSENKDNNNFSHQLATLIGFAGCGISIIPNQVIGVDTKHTSGHPTAQATYQVWKHGNTSRIEYSRVLPIFREFCKKNKP